MILTKPAEYEALKYKPFNITQMKNLIDRLKMEWGIPKKATHRGVETFFRFVCLFNDRAKDIDSTIPNDIKSFLLQSNGAELFKDVDYGQWGLRIYPSTEIIEFNSQIKSWRDDILKTDLIVGDFFGDSDLLAISIDESDFGQIIICRPIDKRKDWYFLKMNFEEFLKKYIENEGDKFWEN